MTTKDYQEKGLLSIFLHFFKPHWKLFALDMVCALLVALVDLAYPLISRKAKQRTGVINADVESSLSGIRTVKAFANEDMEIRKFHASNEEYKGSKRLFHKEMGVFMSAMEFLSASSPWSPSPWAAGSSCGANWAMRISLPLPCILPPRTAGSRSRAPTRS